MRDKYMEGIHIIKNEYNMDGDRVILDELDYREALENGEKIDVSKWNLKGNDMRHLKIKDLHLFVPIRNCFLPVGGSCSSRRYTLTPLINYNDDFIDLRKSDFRGNTVLGSLENIEFNDKEFVYLYNENTFDDDYKSFHHKFFLDKKAPKQLKDFYYNPSIKKVEDIHNHIDWCIAKDGTEYIKKYRDADRYQVLTFDYYLDNYEFLHKKYLDRFKMTKKDYQLIQAVEDMGLNSFMNSYGTGDLNTMKQLLKK